MASADSKHKKTVLKLNSLKDLKKGVLTKGVKSLDEKKKKRIMSQLDTEASAAFRGLLNITEKVAEAHIEPSAFDIVRDIMNCVKERDYKQAFSLVKSLMNHEGVLHSARPYLIQIGNDLAALERDKTDHEMDSNEIQSILTNVNYKLSEITANTVNDVEALSENDFSVIDNLSVTLPAEISEPTVVQNVPLLVLPDRKLRTEGKDVRLLTSGVYIVDATLVGIPCSIPEEAREEMANAFAIQTLGAAVNRNKLSRPDSDATWFPIFSQRFVPDVVQFPDQARRYYGTASARIEELNAQAQAKMLHLRSIRKEFEKDNSDVFNSLYDSQSKLSELEHIAKEKASNFLEKTGFRWNSDMSQIERALEIEHEGDLELLGDNFTARFESNSRFHSRIRLIKKEQELIFKLRQRIMALKRESDEAKDDIQKRKEEAFNPFSKFLKTIKIKERDSGC